MAAAGEDILATIAAQRCKDVSACARVCSEEELHARASQRYPQQPLNLYDALHVADAAVAAPFVVAAEFKRASPSKGPLADPSVCVNAVVKQYVAGGAAVLSILTEPTWFNGSLEDMETARAEAARVAAEPGRQRPVILRKDFILHPYQIAEARAYGADTLLLIVSLLPTEETLKPMIDSSRAAGLEPLVEVNSVPELDVALAAGARVIGINNRNLRTFVVDMGVTARVVAAATVHSVQHPGAELPAILSLSGLRTPDDVASLARECADAAETAVAASSSLSVSDAAAVRRTATRILRGFLVGEALMRAADPRAMVADLVRAGHAVAAHMVTNNAEQASSSTSAPARRTPYVKICGLRSSEDALQAARCGADLLGLICVAGSARYVPLEAAATITSAVRAYREQDPAPLLRAACKRADDAADVAALSRRSYSLMAAATRARPLVVGVFMNETPTHVASVVASAQLDVVQLHGNEDAGEYASALDVGVLSAPIIKVVHIPAAAPGTGSAEKEIAACIDCIRRWMPVASAILLDSKSPSTGAAGGTGLVFDHLTALAALDEVGSIPVMLAGGLSPTNVQEVLGRLRDRSLAVRVIHLEAEPPRAFVWAVDVSSGVEQTADPTVKGVKDAGKVASFISSVRASP